MEAGKSSPPPSAWPWAITCAKSDPPADWAAETSLGESASRVDAARALMEAVDVWYGRLSGNLRDYRKAWRERSFILGKRVRVKQNGKAVPGVAEDVDPLDGIVLRLDSGHPRTIRSEHVEHLEVL